MKYIYLASLLLFATRSFGQAQFASYLIDFSSEYHVEIDSICNTTWAACQILDEPNVYPIYADNGSAWSPATTDGQREFIAVGFDTPIAIDAVYVYQTLNTGAIDTVYVRDASNGNWNLVWSDTAEIENNTAKILYATFPMTSYLVDGVRLALNSPFVPGYNEIDAISIGGVVLGTNDVKNTDVRVSLYPNPSSASFTLTAGHALVETIMITDMTGREVFSNKNVNASQLNIDHNFAAGVYMVKAVGKNFKQSVKLVVE